VVHASVRSFGPVEAGAETVVAALQRVCGTVMMMAGSWGLTVLPAPPGLVRPHNAYWNAEGWADFDERLHSATPYQLDLPVSAWLGQSAETLRTTAGAVRGPHPLISFVAVGDRAADLVSHELLDRPLGPLARLAELDGDVLLLGVDHTSNTTIHLAEQELGFGRFHRYARHGSGRWIELPNVSGESHRFNRIEPLLAERTTETLIGECHARRIRIRDVLEVATRTITNDPAALLCNAPGCRCTAARLQYESVTLGASGRRGLPEAEDLGSIHRGR
ncbi:MAG: AAC(3) family N-acetyltransferase, partial [Propionibacteriales bacterium]|nr:AAC(3) family N-acetyltransferase [Propionibacteriales bacterium]